MTLKRPSNYREPERPISAESGKSASAPASLKQESPGQADRPPLLKIVITEDNHWEFPWSTLYSVHFEKGAETGESGERIDRILLQYIRCEVILKGFNLRKYEKPIHDESLAEICVVHGDYRKAELNKEFEKSLFNGRHTRTVACRDVGVCGHRIAYLFFLGTTCRREWL